MLQETKYAHSGDVNIAYEMAGNGPIDLVIVHGWVATIEGVRGAPGFAQFAQRLSSFARVIQFDKRGTGMSDRGTQAATMDERMDDVRAVMDAVGSERAAIMGISEGGVMAALFAATYPERTSALVLYGAYATFPFADVSEAELSTWIERIRREWRSEDEARRLLSWLTPSLANDEHQIQWAQKFMLLGASPGAVIALRHMNNEIDIRQVVPSIRVPTLVLHRRDDMGIPVASGRDLAARIPKAKFVELEGKDHLFSIGNSNAILDEIEEFLAH